MNIKPQSPFDRHSQVVVPSLPPAIAPADVGGIAREEVIRRIHCALGIPLRQLRKRSFRSAVTYSNIKSNHNLPESSPKSPPKYRVCKSNTAQT